MIKKNQYKKGYIQRYIPFLTWKKYINNFLEAQSYIKREFLF